MTQVQLYEKCLAVINSCVTPRQLDSAWRFIALASPRLTVWWYNEVNEQHYNKRKELGWR